MSWLLYSTAHATWPGLHEWRAYFQVFADTVFATSPCSKSEDMQSMALAGILDGEPVVAPFTIEDPAVLAEIALALHKP